MNTASAANNDIGAGVAETSLPKGLRLGRAARSDPRERDSDRTPVRGFLKIEGAVRAFDFDFRGKTVLDIGSSTGGFTELALERGATRVIAIEKGTNQMKSPLRYDPRVELHEKTDIFTYTPAPDSLPDVIVADVSFLSLTKVLKYARMKLSRSDTDFLAMFKPQFEANPRELSRGVVKNEAIRRDIMKRFEYWLKTNGFIIIKKHDNDLRGKNGNLERFYWLQQAKKIHQS